MAHPHQTEATSLVGPCWSKATRPVQGWARRSSASVEANTPPTLTLQSAQGSTVLGPGLDTERGMWHSQSSASTNVRPSSRPCSQTSTLRTCNVMSIRWGAGCATTIAIAMITARSAIVVRSAITSRRCTTQCSLCAISRLPHLSTLESSAYLEEYDSQCASGGILHAQLVTAMIQSRS